jgi:glycine cleavage system regulatory protein
MPRSRSGSLPPQYPLGFLGQNHMQFVKTMSRAVHTCSSNLRKSTVSSFQRFAAAQAVTQAAVYAVAKVVAQAAA